MATKIVTKNSSTASAVPTASDLVQGELAVNVADKRLFTEDNAGAIVELGTNPSALTVTGEITANGGIALGDNDKATFGDGDDLQIYHNGSKSIIHDVATGNLEILADDFVIKNATGVNTLFFADSPNGQVSLYHSNAAKLATTSTGIDVTGSINSTAAISAVGSGNAVSAAHIPALLGSGSYGGGIASRDGAESGWYQQSSGADWHFYHNRTVASQTPESKKVLSFNSTGSATFTGNVGIGTSSPSTYDSRANNLVVGDSGDAGVTIFSGATSDARLVFAASGDTGLANGVIGYDNNNDSLAFEVAGSERMRIDSSGNVGIGTGSAISIPGFAKVVKLEDSSSASYVVSGGVHEADFAISSSGGYLGTVTNAPMRFVTDSTERMRIDSSGNLLVGTTTYSDNVAGIGLSADNYFYVVRQQDTANAGRVATFNRKGADGSILDFAKDGPAVGSIGVNGGDLYIENGITGISFNNTHNALIPTTTGGVVDDANQDLGISSHRFKNLYLSGGVYLGGTGAANKLDDYEEGTWTPYLDASSTDPSITYNTQVGAYEKIGALVHASFFINVQAVNSQGSGQLRIAGLPFNAASNVNASEVPAVLLQTEPFNAGDGAGYQQFARTNSNSNVLLMGYKTGDGGAAIPSGANNVGTGYLIGHIVYRTDS